MKKLMPALLVLCLSLQAFAAPDETDVVGTWKYRVETDQGDLTGNIIINEKDGALVAEVHTDEGEILAFRKVELREENLLYMELDTGYELMEISLTVKENVMEGTVESAQGSFPLSCEKVQKVQ
jgi:hypothetical protein